MTFPASLRDASSAEVGGCTRSVIRCNARALAALRPGQWLSLLNQMNQVERKLSAAVAFGPHNTWANQRRARSGVARRVARRRPSSSVVTGRQSSLIVGRRSSPRSLVRARRPPSLLVDIVGHRSSPVPTQPPLTPPHPTRRPTSGGASRLGPDGRTSSRRSRV